MSGWYNSPDIIIKENSHLKKKLAEYFGIIFYYQSFSKNAALLMYIMGGGDLSIMTYKIHMVQPTHMQHAGGETEMKTLWQIIWLFVKRL